MEELNLETWKDHVRKAGLAEQTVTGRAHKQSEIAANIMLSCGYVKRSLELNAIGNQLLVQAGVVDFSADAETEAKRMIVSDALGLRRCPVCHDFLPDKSFRINGGYNQHGTCNRCKEQSKVACINCGTPCHVAGYGQAIVCDGLTADGFGYMYAQDPDFPERKDLENLCQACRNARIAETSKTWPRRLREALCEWIAGLLVD